MENVLTHICVTALAVIIIDLRPFPHELKDRISWVVAAKAAHPFFLPGHREGYQLLTK